MNNRITGTANFGGPIKIPHLIKNGPFFRHYYRIPVDAEQQRHHRLRTCDPTLAERGGDLSALPVQIFNPVTGIPYTNNMIPVSAQAASLLNLFPQPNITGNPQFNYQAPIVTDTKQDAMQVRLNKTVGRKDSLSGVFAFQDLRLTTPNLFGFVDTTDSLGINFQTSWSHRFSPRLGETLTYQFSRLASTAIPNFANVTNISGAAGITGNNQDPTNWGPPALGFSTINGLSDGQSSHNRTQNQTASIGDNVLWTRRNHSLQIGGDINRREINILSQQNPRGAFQFNGTATQEIVGGNPVAGTGSDLADFLLGVPGPTGVQSRSATRTNIFRQTVYDAYVDDDWRVTPQLSVHVGLRWDYGSPYTELFGRLVNLDITPTFGAVVPVIASNPVGTLTNQQYPNSLVRPDKHGIQPRFGLSWRPISGSSILVKAGYGINVDTSISQSIAIVDGAAGRRYQKV